MKAVVTTFSGGVDSTLCAILLKEEYAFDPENIFPINLDVGQGEEEIENAWKRAKILDKKFGIPEGNFTFLDTKEEFVNDFVFPWIKANGRYFKYPVGTSMTRVLVAKKAAELAKEKGAEAVCHGCTGKGNDQFRMENTIKYVDRNLKIIAPVKELDLDRKQEEEMLYKKFGIPERTGIRKRGGDVNLISNSIGSGRIDDLKTQLSETEYLWVKPIEKTPDKRLTVELYFEEGVFKSLDLDGKKIYDPVKIIEILNIEAGRHGIGKLDILEPQRTGLKSREIYEAPAAQILLEAHEDLENLTLTNEQLIQKRHRDMEWGVLVYNGDWFDDAKKDIDAYNNKANDKVTGTVKLEFYKGCFNIVERSSPYSLFKPELRSLYSKGVKQSELQGATIMSRIKYEVLNMRDQGSDPQRTS